MRSGRRPRSHSADTRRGGGRLGNRAAGAEQPRELPAGTVTLLFSDIEGSTRLLEERGNAYASLLSKHHAAIRAATARHSGAEVDTQGDAFFLAFSDADEAVAAAGEIHDQLKATPIRVRIGVHTGTPLLAGDGYVGMDVHAGARICAAGHGGQTLLSDVTAQGLARPPPLEDLGVFRLKGVSRPYRLLQVGRASFPPPRTVRPGNLAVQPSRLLGRDRDVDELVDLLDRGARLITIVGPAGVGKTRVAQGVAAEAQRAFEDGVYFVDLTRIRDAGLVESALAEPLGGRVDPSERIGQQQMLVVVDNMEHLLEAAPLLADLIAACPRLTLLTTSRAPLGLSVEQIYDLEPLPPEAAVELFVERARAANRSFEADQSVSQLCARLDHLPLAIELAAMRVRAVSPQSMLDRLDERLALPAGGLRGIPARQRTLSAAIGWSVELLSAPARLLLPRLGVFVGGWTVSAAATICDAGFDELVELVDHSLIRHRGGRYSMLEVVRSHAWTLLLESGEAKALQDRHAKHFADMAADATVPWLGSRVHLPETAYPFVTVEQGNLRAALAWLELRGAGPELLRMAVALWGYWRATGATDEGERWCRAAIDLNPSTDSAQARWIRGVIGEFPRYAGEPQRAIPMKLEALRLSRQYGDDSVAAAILADLTSLHLAVGNRHAATLCADESLLLREKEGQLIGIAHALVGRGEVALAGDDLAGAEQSLRRAQAMEVEGGTDKIQQLETAALLAETIRRQGRAREARTLFDTVLAESIAVDYQSGVINSMVGLAALSVDDDPAHGAELLGHVASIRRRAHVAPSHAARLDFVADELRSRLGDTEYEAAYQRALSAEGKR